MTKKNKINKHSHLRKTTRTKTQIRVKTYIIKCFFFMINVWAMREKDEKKNQLWVEIWKLDRINYMQYLEIEREFHWKTKIPIIHRFK